MRLAAITPIRVPPEELARRQRRYDLLAPPPLRVRLHNLPDGPSALETAGDIRRSAELVARAIEDLDPATYDAVLPDCVLDPAVTGPPVYGILRLTAGFLAGCGLPFGAVTRNAAIGAELADRLRAYGMDGGYVGGAVLGLDVAAVADHPRWNAALGEAVARLGAEGAAVVLNGCSAVDVTVDLGTPVIDPTALALRLLATGADALPGRRAA